MPPPKAIEVTPQIDYNLLVTFDNNERRIFDVKPYLDFYPYKELKNLILFYTVKLTDQGVEWIHGQDIDPDDLYNNSVLIEV